MARPDESSGRVRSAAGGVGPGRALRGAWRRSGGWPGLLAASAPTAVFVTVSVLFGLVAAVVTAAAAAVAVFATRIVRREPLGSAAAGLAVAVVCALAAALTGDDRGFFLLPTAAPAVLAVVCLGTLLARRPLTGLAFNRIAGGPRSWWEHPGLQRIYTVTTILAAALFAANFGLRALLLATDRTALLAVVYTLAGPVVVVFAAATVVAVRRHLRRAAAGSPRRRVH